MKEEQALIYKKLAEENNITLTIHAPYYISLASMKEDVVERSKLEIKKAFELGCTVYSGKPIDQDRFEQVLKKFGLI